MPTPRPPSTQENQVHLLLHVAGGRDARVAFHSSQEASAFAARIGAAASQARTGTALLAEALARGAVEPAAWVARLRAATQLGAHRTAAVARDQLWSLVESASMEPLQRAAAAVALGRDLDEPSRRRVADVASATASPRLRVVLEQVSAGADDEALAEALAELEVEARSASPR